MKLDKFAVWTFLDGLKTPAATSLAQKIEDWGYNALWIPEAVGREPMAFAATLLENTDKLIVATGIASTYARDARASRMAQLTLNESYDGRFLLGLGVSHAPMVEGMRGQHYGKPVATMKAYLEYMQQTMVSGVTANIEAKTVIAALGPKMLALSKTHADGAHPYLVTPEHTEQARGIIGPGKWLCVEQKVILQSDAAKARDIARKALAIYLGLPNYRNNLLRLGFSADEIDKNGGADRLVDALVAWGDEKTIATRLQAHLDAGADQVCIQPLHPEGLPIPDERVLKALAPKG